MCKKIISVVLVLTVMALGLCLVACGGSSEPKADVGPQYITAATLKDKLDNGDAIKFVDVQGEGAASYAKGAVKTTTADITADTMKGFGKSTIIIVGDDAEAARDALVAAGGDSSKMYILEGGMADFTYPDYVE
jgi:hypothetical protein